MKIVQFNRSTPWGPAASRPNLDIPPPPWNSPPLHMQTMSKRVSGVRYQDGFAQLEYFLGSCLSHVPSLYYAGYARDAKESLGGILHPPTPRVLFSCLASGKP